MEENKTFEEQTVFVNESLETMLLLIRVANIYANASDILKNKKEYLVKKDWLIGELKYWKGDTDVWDQPSVTLKTHPPASQMMQATPHTSKVGQRNYETRLEVLEQLLYIWPWVV